jgi:hypothetical protein
MNKDVYQSSFTQTLSELNSDLANSLITEEEYKILLGLHLQKEFHRSIQHDFDVLISPLVRKKHRSASYLQYNWERTVSYNA